jgi:hypothetical protein
MRFLTSSLLVVGSHQPSFACLQASVALQSLTSNALLRCHADLRSHRPPFLSLSPLFLCSHIALRLVSDNCRTLGNNTDCRSVY